MKKIMAAALTCVIAAAMLAGCGSGDMSVKLGKYKGLEIDNQTVEISDDDVTRKMQSEFNYDDRYEDITDRPAQMGDTVNISFQGLKDGVPFAGGTSAGTDLTLGSETFIPGFEAEVVGMSIGDTKSFYITFPEEYQASELAGKEVEFIVTLKSIKRRLFTSMTDEWVESYTEGEMKTIQEFRKAMHDKVYEIKENALKATAKSQLFEQVMADSKITLTAEEIEEENEKLIAQYEKIAEGYGQDLDQYFADCGYTEEEAKAKIKQDAEDSVKERKVVEAIFNKEKMELTEEDYNALLDYYQSTPEKMIETYGEEKYKEYVMTYKILEFLYENAKQK